MPEYQLEILDSEMRDLPRSLQTQIMSNWFHERFEDPAIRTPYESREGGYQWIYGGPYEARDQIEDRFADYVDQGVMDELIEELDQMGQWAPVESEDDYEDYALDDSLETRDCHKEFNDAVTSVREMLAQTMDEEHVAKYRALLYSNVITAMETYLFDSFAQQVLYHRPTLRRFLETYGKFSEEKIKKSVILTEADDIENTVKKTISDIVWHNLPRIKPMYADTLDVEFLDFANLQHAILKRHDFAHRNGRDKDGNDVVVSKSDVETLIENVVTFIDDVDTKVKSRNKHAFEFPEIVKI